MNVTHINPHIKKKISLLPVDGNYLIPEAGGRLRWAEPNDSWRVMTQSGRQKVLISNIRFDDTDHSPDLWLYSLLGADEKQAINERIMLEEIGKEPVPYLETMLAHQNRVHLDPSRKWYVRQYVENLDRAGIRRFAGIPLNAWLAMWRRTIAMEDIEIYGMTNNQMKIIFAGLHFSVYLQWPELQRDMNGSNTTTQHDGRALRRSNDIIPWLNAHCRRGIIPFSDYDSMFPDACDEITYTIDKAMPL